MENSRWGSSSNGREQSGRGGRTPSRAWDRLKPVNLDPLEAMGLPSKGDNRLLNFKAQEQYYTKIVDRYMSFCSSAGRGDELLRRLASLTLEERDAKNGISGKPASSTVMPNTPRNSSGTAIDQDGSKDLAVLTMAMRKLREGIVASKRCDDFSTQAYIFCIRFSILLKHMESYQPALLHLLFKMHPVRPLSRLDLQEFMGYLVLDLACRQQDLAQAYLVRHKSSLNDPKINSVLDAMVRDDYHLFWRVKKTVDGYKAKLMEFAEDGMRMQALKCLGRTYFTVPLPFLEQVTNSSWKALVADQKVGWELNGNEVIIRRPKAR